MKISTLLIAGGMALAMLPTVASAQSQMIRGEGYYNPANEAPPLIVRKRAFTDSGTAASVGYDNEYLVDQTTLHSPVYSSYRPDMFGQQLLPHRFDGLGLN